MKSPYSPQNPGFVQIHTQKVNSSWWVQRDPSLHQTRSQLFTHCSPRTCACPSNQPPHTERDGGSGRTQLKRHCERVSTSIYIHLIIIIQCSCLQRGSTTFHPPSNGEQARPRGSPFLGTTVEGGGEHGQKGCHATPFPLLPCKGHPDSSKSDIKDKVSDVGLSAPDAPSHHAETWPL